MHNIILLYNNIILMMNIYFLLITLLLMSAGARGQNTSEQYPSFNESKTLLSFLHEILDEKTSI